MAESSFEDIPGTTLFDGRMSRIGYHLNMFCMSLIKAENRVTFKADEASYLDRFSLTADQRRAVLERRWNDLLETGGNGIFTLGSWCHDSSPRYPPDQRPAIRVAQLFPGTVL